MGVCPCLEVAVAADDHLGHVADGLSCERLSPQVTDVFGVEQLCLRAGNQLVDVPVNQLDGFPVESAVGDVNDSAADTEGQISTLGKLPRSDQPGQKSRCRVVVHDYNHLLLLYIADYRQLF